MKNKNEKCCGKMSGTNIFIGSLIGVAVLVFGGQMILEQKDVPLPKFLDTEKIDNMLNIDNGETPAMDEVKYKTYSATAMNELKGLEKFVVFFYADWCSTCKAWDKAVRRNLDELPEGTVILKADYDNEADLVKEYGVTTQSTAVFFNADGTVAETVIDPKMEKVKEFFGGAEETTEEEASDE